jgi:competence protein ComEA
MPERDPRRLAAWAAAILVLLLLSAWYLARSRPAADASPPAVATIAVAAGRGNGGDGPVVVDVAGAVNHPGVYRLPSSARVEDALKRAGGATRRADLSQVNRAAKVEDGRQILVPVRAPRVAAASAAAPGAPAPPEPPVNLNTATLEQLDTLDGVGPSTAKKILDYRTVHGGFGNVDELDQIPGIGEKRLAALREHVRV